jgi:predicted RNA-binding protein with RPS1 domain
VEVKILKVDTDARKIGLSLRRVKWAAEEQSAETGKQRTPSGPEKVLSDADVVQLKKQKEAPDGGKKTDAGPDESDDRQPDDLTTNESQADLTDDSPQTEI